MRSGFRSTLLPLAQANTLPGAAFADLHCFELDRALFAKSWQCIGHESELAPLGFVAHELFGERICVTRNADGQLAGFFDRCLHRGTPLTDGACGATEGELVCPYHGLRYQLDGSLLRSSPETIRTRENCLPQVRVAVFRSFVFVSTASTEPIEAWMGPIPPWLERAELQSLRLVSRSQHELRANWKLCVENFQESHHFPQVHPLLEAATPWRESRSIDFGGAWLGGVMPLAGVETVALTGLRAEREFIAAQMDRSAVHDAMLFPAWLTSLQPDYFLSYRLLPQAVDRTLVVADIYFHASAGAHSADDVTRFWDRTNAEDRAICERQQRGVAAPSYEPSCYASVEDGVHAFDTRIARAYLDEPGERDERGPPRQAPIHGIFGEPFQRLDELIGQDELAAIDREVTLGLSQVESSYTGGSLKWMGVVAPWCMKDDYRDLMHAIQDFSAVEFAEFNQLADDPGALELGRQHEYRFGDETDHPLNKAQMRYLAYRHGVYFPWKVCYHLLENERWDDKHSGSGKAFGQEALSFFPRTIAAIRNLPFREIGRAVIFGLEPNDHAPLHRDSEPGASLAIAQSISIDPRGNKRFFLTNGEGDEPLVVDSRIYWFNDVNYHGVLGDPFFRYSIRVDGQFTSAFVKALERRRRR